MNLKHRVDRSISFKINDAETVASNSFNVLGRHDTTYFNLVEFADVDRAVLLLPTTTIADIDAYAKSVITKEYLFNAIKHEGTENSVVVLDGEGRYTNLNSITISNLATVDTIASTNDLEISSNENTIITFNRTKTGENTLILRGKLDYFTINEGVSDYEVILNNTIKIENDFSITTRKWVIDQISASNLTISGVNNTLVGADGNGNFKEIIDIIINADGTASLPFSTYDDIVSGNSKVIATREYVDTVATLGAINVSGQNGDFLYSNGSGGIVSTNIIKIASNEITITSPLVLNGIKSTDFEHAVTGLWEITKGTDTLISVSSTEIIAPQLAKEEIINDRSLTTREWVIDRINSEVVLGGSGDLIYSTGSGLTSTDLVRFASGKLNITTGASLITIDGTAISSNGSIVFNAVNDFEFNINTLNANSNNSFKVSGREFEGARLTHLEIKENATNGHSIIRVPNLTHEMIVQGGDSSIVNKEYVDTVVSNSTVVIGGNENEILLSDGLGGVAHTDIKIINGEITSTLVKVSNTIAQINAGIDSAVITKGYFNSRITFTDVDKILVSGAGGSVLSTGISYSVAGGVTSLGADKLSLGDASGERLLLNGSSIFAFGHDTNAGVFSAFNVARKGHATQYIGMQYKPTEGRIVVSNTEVTTYDKLVFHFAKNGTAEDVMTLTDTALLLNKSTIESITDKKHVTTKEYVDTVFGKSGLISTETFSLTGSEVIDVPSTISLVKLYITASEDTVGANTAVNIHFNNIVANYREDVVIKTMASDDIEYSYKTLKSLTSIQIPDSLKQIAVELTFNTTKANDVFMFSGVITGVRGSDHVRIDLDGTVASVDTVISTITLEYTNVKANGKYSVVGIA